MYREILFALAKGPFMWIAFFVFFGGLLFQTGRFFSLTRKQTRIRFAAGGRFDPGAAKARSHMELIDRRARLKTTILGTHPAMAINSVVFHTSFFLVTLFDNAHVEVWLLSWGIRLPSIAESVSHVAIVLFFISSGYYLLRRIFVARVRAISSFMDYAILAVALAPVLSGYLAAHHFFNYHWLMLIHILSSQLLLIVLPFSKLTHMVFFFLNRFFLGHEYSFTRGGRAWPLNAQRMP